MERIKLNIQRFADKSMDLEIGADVSKALDGIKKLTTSIEELKTKLKASNIEYGSNTKEVEVLNQRHDLLNQTLSKQKSLLSKLKKVLKSQGEQTEENAKQQEKLEKAINKTGNEITLTEARLAKNNKKLDEAAEETKKAAEETYTYKDALKELGSSLNVSYIIGAIKRLASTLYTDFISKTIDTTEELNLFNVVFDNMQKNGEKTFSELGKQATSFQKRLNEAFGTNMKETMRYQGLFQAMGESAGLEDTVANLMSENMTKLAYDLASLYNTTETKAAESLRAGVYAGQTKPLRNYGIDVTQTSYKPLLEELGIDKSVSELTQAEKEILRYISTLNQAKNAMGDFANTIESPANQLKVLRQQFYEMQAAIGNLFVGAFSRILPYVNAIIMVIKEVARVIAGFFGFELQDFNSGIAAYAEDLNEYEEAVGGVGDSADGAAGSIKELKRQVLGFDQINNLTTPTPSSGGSGGGGGAGGGVLGGIDDRLLAALKGYDNGMEKVRMKANEIRDKMMEILGFTRDINGEWEWGGFTKMIKNIKKWFDGLDFKGKVIAVTGMATAFTTLFNILKKIGNLTGVTTLFKTIGKVAKKLIPTATATAATAGTEAAAGAEAAAGTAAAGTGLGAGATAGIVAAGIAGNIALIYSLSEAYDTVWAKAQDFFDGKGLNFTWLDKLKLGIGTIAANANPVLVPLTVSFKSAINMFKKSIEPVTAEDILDLAGVSDKTKETLGVVLKDYERFTQDLNLIQILNKTAYDENGGILGTIITQENVDELKRLFGEATNVTLTSLEEQKTNTLSNLDKLKDKLGDKYDEMKKKIEDHYEGQKKSVNDANDEINKILENAYAERGYLTKDEMDRINEIRQQAQDNAITELSDSEAEMLAIRQTMKDKAVDLNITQAAEIIQKSAETRDAIIKDAEEQYDSVLKEAEKLKAAGIINDDEYEKMRDAAFETYTVTVDNARKQHQEIYDEFANQNKDIAKYIDEDTGQVKSKWQTFCDSIKNWWNSLWGKTEDHFQNNVRPQLTQDGKDAVNDVQSGIDSQNTPEIKVNANTSQLKTTVDGAINYIDTGTASVKVGADMSSANNTLTSWKNGLYANFGFSIKANGGVFANGRWQPIQAYANGGVPSGGQLFMAREAGPELVGKIGRHTAVMNNNQIVDSVKAGVYEAVSAAMSQGGMGSVQIDLHTDEGVVVDRINRITRQTGNCPIEI